MRFANGRKVGWWFGWMAVGEQVRSEQDPVEILGSSLASGVQAASIHEVRISVIYSNLNMLLLLLLVTTCCLL